ncbi:MAG: hypothetical protein A2V88_02675 [Elusimicrobia bacterium RBG_16_66_12]|nr:MAG: hypothetical protein A2V88_02675 [Elusimicrobia bacterium RBG_16_66_12]
MGFFFTSLLYAGFTILSRLLQPQLPQTERAKRDPLAAPTADPTRPIPVVWGSVYLNDPNVIWWGNIRVSRTSGQGLYINGPVDVDLYVVGVTAVLCHGPVDPLPTYYWDDKPLTPDAIAYNSILEITTVHKNRSFELIAREHFVYSVMYNQPTGYLQFGDIYHFYRGTNIQEPDPAEVAAVGVPLPPYRGVAYAHLGNVLLGASIQGAPPMQRLAVGVARRPNQLGITPGREQIANDANPACMLYEILTDTRWGMALPSTVIDVVSFRAAGEALYAEGTGMSLVVNDQTPGRSLIDDILRHIDASLFTDPATGLLTLKLARNDYVFDDLPVFDKSNVLSVELSRPSWTETKNHVRVKYSGQLGSERVAAETNLANVQMRGGIVSLDVSYPGFTSATTAQRAAARDLKTVSYPFARVALEVNRKAWSVRPGGVFRLTWEPLGIVDLVCRVARVEPGLLTNGTIHIDAVEDAFAVNWTGLPVSGGEWVDPSQPPLPVAAQRLEESPYALAGGLHRQVLTLGSRGPGLMQGYAVWSDPAGGEEYALTNPQAVLTPMGLLDGVMGYKSTTLKIVAGTDLETLFSITPAVLDSGRNLLLIDNEWIAWQDVVRHGDGTATITGCVRGVMDTAPRRHVEGAHVWFPTSGAGLASQTDYGSDITLAAKLRTINMSKTLPLASAGRVTTTTENRAARPYCPTAVLLNGQSYPKALAGELTVSWQHRNRLGAWSFADAGITGSPEASTTYTVRIYGDGGGYGQDWGKVWGRLGSLKHTETGLTGTSYLYPAATEMAENGGNMNTFRRITVEAIVSGLGSRQLYDYAIGDNSGWGYDWGSDFGQ